ncbi:MAG TPA: ATP-binding protein, partial [Oligoflexia bacterium]|nr:ATP-binding protein [Oligoflexia bacterium]
MFYDRCLKLPQLLKKKSLLLLGPRQTGKSTLALHAFPEAVYVNLAAADVFRELSERPELVRQRLAAHTKVLIFDEAQRIPAIFDEVQLLLDRNKQLRVLLTGSSARKLRRTGVNLLPGRIWQAALFPLVFPELGEGRIKARLQRGSLPGFIDSEDYRRELKNYVGLYLDEEVRAEGLVRGIGDFSRFLNIAALSNGEQLNFTKISSDTGIKVNTVRSYFQILEDTLI